MLSRAVELLDALVLKFKNLGLTFVKATGEIKSGNNLIGKLEGNLLRLEKNGLELVEDAGLAGKIEDFPEINKVLDDGIEYPTEGLRIDASRKCAGVGTYCFEANTEMVDGRKINEMKVNDKIETINPTTGEKIEAVIKNIKTSLTKRLTEVMIAGR